MSTLGVPARELNNYTGCTSFPSFLNHGDFYPFVLLEISILQDRIGPPVGIQE
jgi:hypothetical protein